MAITLDGTNGILSPDFEPSSSTTPTNGLFLPATNALGFATNSTERLRLDASGNLGLGVTPSASDFYALTVGVKGNSFFATGQNDVIVSSNAYYSSGWKYAYTNTASYYEQYAGKHIWFTAPSGTAGNAISFTQAMTLDASGNLGIGTSSPSTYGQLSLYRASGDVEAAVVTGGANYATYRIQNSTNRYSMQIRTDVSNAWVLRDETNSANRLVVDTSGNLLVGTTGIGIVSGPSIIASVQPANETWLGINHNSSASSGGWYVGFRYNGSAIGSITQSGTTAVAYNTSSDQRLKENIVDAPSALSSVNAIKVRSFDWKSDGSHVDYGYIAQELLEVVPEAVSIPADPEEMMGVDFGKLTPRLVKAIQELTARLEALENK